MVMNPKFLDRPWRAGRIEVTGPEDLYPSEEYSIRYIPAADGMDFEDWIDELNTGHKLTLDEILTKYHGTLEVWQP